MIKSIIAAVAENNVIGKNNDLVWHLPADLKYFKETTKGHFVMMGRKTFESFGKPLRNRTHIIITRDKNYSYPDCYVVHNLQEAYDIAEKNNQQEIFILGGAEIYRQSIDQTDRLYITEIRESFDGDTFFPEINKNKWKEVERNDFEPDEKNKYPYSFVRYERVSTNKI